MGRLRWHLRLRSLRPYWRSSTCPPGLPRGRRRAPTAFRVTTTSGTRRVSSASQPTTPSYRISSGAFAQAACVVRSACRARPMLCAIAAGAVLPRQVSPLPWHRCSQSPWLRMGATTRDASVWEGVPPPSDPLRQGGLSCRPMHPCPQLTPLLTQVIAVWPRAPSCVVPVNGCALAVSAVRWDRSALMGRQSPAVLSAASH